MVLGLSVAFSLRKAVVEGAKTGGFRALLLQDECGRIYHRLGDCEDLNILRGMTNGAGLELV
jgi:hypothetical protein